MEFDSIIGLPAKLRYGLFFCLFILSASFSFFLTLYIKKRFLNVEHSLFLGLQFLKEPHAKAQKRKGN